MAFDKPRLRALFDKDPVRLVEELQSPEKPAQIAVYGAGYVGLIQAVGLQLLGHSVTLVEIDEARIESLRSGRMPFFEAGMDAGLTAALKRGLKIAKRLETDPDCVFIAVGTPTDSQGRQDLSALFSVIDALPEISCPVVTKSTVLPGTAQRVERRLNDRGLRVPVVSNPEFLREGHALFDFLVPDRVVIGSEKVDRELFTRIYSFCADRIFFTNAVEAEIAKYAANLMLVTKISFANEIGNICKNLGADGYTVMDIVGADDRVNRSFLDSGIGYGGSCFPKDLRALESFAQRRGLSTNMLTAARTVNEVQPSKAVQLARSILGDLEGAKIAVLGLAFKPGTEDTRQSLAEPIIRDLLEYGAQVRVNDPRAESVHVTGKDFVSEKLPDVLSWCDLVILATEWQEYENLDFGETPVVLGRRIEVRGTNLHGITW